MATVTRQESTFYTHTLSNGLQMVGQLMPEVESAAAIFWVKTGTRDEPEGAMGVSHFLEHMAFRGTEKLSGADIDRAFEEMGAEHNAATWLEMTFYWARVLSENASWAVEILADLTHPKLDAEAFEQERPVILEEIARYQDMPVHVLIDRFMTDFFGNHPLSWRTLGTPESIKNLTLEQMRSYWQQRYGTKNMIFAVAGSFDWESMVAEVETLSREWQPGESGRALSPATFQPGFDVDVRQDFAQEQIAIGTPMVSRADGRYYQSALLATILGDDTGSRLFWALHQTGLAETATAQTMDFEDNGLLLVHLATQPEQAVDALRATREQMKRLQDFDVQQDELDRAKAKLTSSVIIGGESTNERVMELIRSWLTLGKLETLEDIRHKIEAVTLEEIHQLLREFPIYPNQVITAVGPVDEQSLRAVIQGDA